MLLIVILSFTEGYDHHRIQNKQNSCQFYNAVTTDPSSDTVLTIG